MATPFHAASRKRARMPSAQGQGDAFVQGSNLQPAAQYDAYATLPPDAGPTSAFAFNSVNPFVPPVHSLASRTSTPSSVASGHSPPTISPVRDEAYKDFGYEGYPSYGSSPTSSSFGAPSSLPPPALQPTSHPASSPSTKVGQASTSFRNVSACNRCRVRKNKCDQKLPACSSCEKAGVKCVGFDPFLNRPVPRSYVFYLETRVAHLEGLLSQHNVPFSSAEEFALDNGLESDPGDGDSGVVRVKPQSDDEMGEYATKEDTDLEHRATHQTARVDRLASNIDQVSVQGASEPRYLGSTSGISFARVVFAALKKSASRAPSERGSARPSTGFSAAAAGVSSMRDSVFGLQSKPSVEEAPFPQKELGLRLVDIYFEIANPQMPILHRMEYMSMFERVYQPGHELTPRETYLLNIVFAIGAGSIFDTGSKPDGEDVTSPQAGSHNPKKKARLAAKQAEPEEYHAAAIVHLESFLNSSPASDRPEGFGGGLEELQAVLLLAQFALLRPVSPGLWYIVGVAMRLAVDMGLHYENGADTAVVHSKASPNNPEGAHFAEAETLAEEHPHQKEIARRAWVRDLRRRLWWCVYSFDRLVSTVVGRPFSVSDQVVTTEFPSLLDDKFLTPTGFLTPPRPKTPTYKLNAHHYFRLRLLQSEIVQVLQYKSAQRAYQSRRDRKEVLNPYTLSDLRSQFLDRFGSFLDWRQDIDRRLREWKDSIPAQEATGVRFNPQLLELNYWQAVILLYRSSVITPSVVAAEERTGKDGMTSPHEIDIKEEGDLDHIHLKIAEAGEKVIKIYLQLHRQHLVNYTYLATHHLFMAGISFLYAIWHSPLVRSKLNFDQVEFTVFAATSVFSDLTTKCEPAETCKEAFERMGRIIINLCLSTTGFGEQALKAPRKKPKPKRAKPQPTPGDIPRSSTFPPRSTPAQQQPQFDMDLGDLLATRDMQQHAQAEAQAQAGFPQPTSSGAQQHPFPNVSIPYGNFPPQNMAPPSPTPSDYADQQWEAIQYNAPYVHNPTLSDFGDLPDNDMSFMMEDVSALNQTVGPPPAGGQYFGGANDPANLHLLGVGGLDGTRDFTDGVVPDVFGGYFFGGGTATGGI